MKSVCDKPIQMTTFRNYFAGVLMLKPCYKSNPCFWQRIKLTSVFCYNNSFGPALFSNNDNSTQRKTILMSDAFLLQTKYKHKLILRCAFTLVEDEVS